MEYLVNNEKIELNPEDVEFVLPYFQTNKLILKNQEYHIEKIDKNPSTWILTRCGKAFGVREV